MGEVNENWYQEKKRKGDFYLLDEALEEQIEKYPPTSRSDLYAYWSSDEGMWAEALPRKNKKAEIRAVQAEAMEAMAHLTGEEIKGTQEKIDKSVCHWSCQCNKRTASIGIGRTAGVSNRSGDRCYR